MPGDRRFVYYWVMLARFLMRQRRTLFIALLTILLLGPLWQQAGLPISADMALHIHRGAAVQRAIEQGIYWPRWFPTVYNGLGAPTFHHYSPGLYLLVGAIHWTGIRLDVALKIVVTAAFVLSGLGVCAWLRQTFSLEAGLAGIALYLAQTHVFREFYFLGDYPQLLAILLLPVCLWSIAALHRQSRVGYWVAAVVSLASLVVSHNLTTMIGAGVLGLYWVMLAVCHRKLDGLLRCAAAALLAAALSAGFWLPALADTPHVQIGNLQRGFFHFGQYFLSWRELTAVQPLFLDSRAGNSPVPHAFGLAPCLAIAAGLVSVILFAARKSYRVWAIGGSLFSLAMLTLTLPVTELLWETIPGLNLIQFPSRFLPIATLGALPAAAVAIDTWPKGRRWFPALALMLISIIFSFPFLFPAHIFPFLPATTLTAEDTIVYEQSSGVWGMSGANEFLPQGAVWDAITGQKPMPSATRLTWNSPHEAHVTAIEGRQSEQAEPMLLRLHFHPGWSAEDGAVLTQGAAGWVEVADRRDPTQPLRIVWAGTGWQRWGERLSLIGLLFGGTGLLYLALRHFGPCRWRSKRQATDRSDVILPTSSDLSIGAMVACVLVLVAARFVLDQFGGRPFLRHPAPGQMAIAVEGQPTTLGAEANSQVTLLGWELLHGTTPQPGDAIMVRLYWQPKVRIKEDLHSFLHLYTPSMQRSWAVTQNYYPSHTTAQHWDLDKYYVDTLHLTIPADIPPVTFSLVAGLMTPTGERLSVPGVKDGMVRLRLLSIAPGRAGFLQKERATVRARADTGDGLRLQGYDLLSEPGGPVLRLFWETRGVVVTDWTTYIHLHNAQGERIAQFDGPALAGLSPTSQWQSRGLYIDKRQLKLAIELQPGEYLLRIGLYNFSSGERLPFLPDTPEQGRFEDGQLIVPLTIPDSDSSPITGAGN